MKEQEDGARLHLQRGERLMAIPTRLLNHLFRSCLFLEISACDVADTGGSPFTQMFVSTLKLIK